MSENIKLVHMQQSGPIPGVVGWFSGGQTVSVDLNTMTVVDQSPMQQQAYDASPLVESAPETPAEEPVQEAQPEQPIEPTPAQEEAMPEVVAVPDLPENTPEGAN